MMLWMVLRVSRDQRSPPRHAADREEADQVLWRRQHGDVLDAFVVGFTGAVGGLGIVRPSPVAEASRSCQVSTVQVAKNRLSKA